MQKELNLTPADLLMAREGIGRLAPEVGGAERSTVDAWLEGLVVNAHRKGGPLYEKPLQAAFGVLRQKDIPVGKDTVKALRAGLRRIHNEDSRPESAIL